MPSIDEEEPGARICGDFVRERAESHDLPMHDPHLLRVPEHSRTVHGPWVRRLENLGNAC